MLMRLLSLVFCLFLWHYLLIMWPTNNATAVIATSGGFLNLVERSMEGDTRGALSSIRSALAYRGENGRYPETLEALDPKYFTAIQQAQLPRTGHVYFTKVQYLSSEQYRNRELSDDGGWIYVSSGTKAGLVGVNCLHNDLKGQPWIGQ